MILVHSPGQSPAVTQPSSSFRHIETRRTPKGFRRESEQNARQISLTVVDGTRRCPIPRVRSPYAARSDIGRTPSTFDQIDHLRHGKARESRRKQRLPANTAFFFPSSTSIPVLIADDAVNRNRSRSHRRKELPTEPKDGLPQCTISESWTGNRQKDCPAYRIQSRIGARKCRGPCQEGFPGNGSPCYVRRQSFSHRSRD